MALKPKAGSFEEFNSEIEFGEGEALIKASNLMAEGSALFQMEGQEDVLVGIKVDLDKITLGFVVGDAEPNQVVRKGKIYKQSKNEIASDPNQADDSIFTEADKFFTDPELKKEVTEWVKTSVVNHLIEYQDKFTAGALDIVIRVPISLLLPLTFTYYTAYGVETLEIAPYGFEYGFSAYNLKSISEKT